MAITLSQDSEGWTIFTPDAGARLFYIEAGGSSNPTDDYYSPAQIGGNPFNPDANMDDPYDTYASVIASGYVRDGYGDYILFKRGETFSANITLKSGAAIDDFSVVGWYGASGNAPLIKPASVTTAMVTIPPDGTEYAAVVGLYFYSTTRDPLHGDYVGDSGAYGFVIDQLGQPTYTVQQILLEGCKWKFFPYNLIKEHGTITDLVIRRCVVLDAYWDAAHSQGLYHEGQSGGEGGGLILEECIFDHNGWYGSGGIGDATEYNHNTYFSHSDNITFSKNIFSRPSNINNKFTSTTPTYDSQNITLDDNLYIDGTVAGASFGTNGPVALYGNITVTNNVLTELNYSEARSGLTFTWGFDINDWDTGVFSGNLIIHCSNSNMVDIKPVLSSNGGDDVEITNNILYDLNPSSGLEVHFLISAGRSRSNWTVSGNKFQDPGVDNRLMYVPSSAFGYVTFSNNIYYANNESTAFSIDASNESYTTWVSESGETGSSWLQESFTAPTRSIETYMSHLGQTATLEAFWGKIRAMDRFNWDTDYTAETVNTWLRVGFDMEEGEGEDVEFNTSLILKFG